MSDRSSLSYRTWMLLAGALILMCLPRFNKNAVVFPSAAGDEEVYAHYVEFFRGDTVTGPLTSASTWRPLVPFIAALLPFAPMTAINLVNVASLLFALFMLARILEWFALPRGYHLAGCALFIFSFPTLYYGSIGYVDPMLLGLVTLGVYLILSRRWIAFTLLLLPGVLAKEGIVVLLPPALFFLILGENSRRKWLFPVVWILIYVGLSLAVRRFAPGVAYDQFWVPSTEKLIENVTRARVWIGAILTLGPPGAVALMLLLRPQWLLAPSPRTMLAIGFLSVLATWVTALVTAYADGRTLWVAFPFTIPLMMVWLHERKSGRFQSPSPHLNRSWPDEAEG